MGLGQLLLDRWGMRKSRQRLFEQILKLGASGLGYGAPAMGGLSKSLEEVSYRARRRSGDGAPETVFDIGANRGMYISMLHHVHGAERPRVHAFEPDPELAAGLSATYGNDPMVKVVAAGVSDRPGTATFFKHAQDDLSSLHAAADHPSRYRNTAVRSSFEVPLVTVDDHCAEHGIERIDHLKIDTEGHDLFVLRGARRMIAEGRILNIQFEFSEMNLLSHTTFFEHWSLLHERYEIFRPCRDGFYRIEAYDPVLHEVYHVVNFFASLRT